jgi:signal transduction histidine kinase
LTRRQWDDAAACAGSASRGRIRIKAIEAHASIERNIVAGFGVAIAFLIIIAGFAYRNAHSYVETNQWVVHTYQVLGTLSEISTRLNEAESQQRAYLITTDNRYLQWRDRVFSEIRGNVGELSELTADNPIQRQRIPDLEQKIATRLETMEGTRRLRDMQGIEAVQQRILSGVGPVAMDSIRAVLRVMETEERRLLELRTADVKRNADVLLWISAAVIVVISLFLGWLLTVIRRQMAEGKQAGQAIVNLNADLHRQTKQLSLANKELEGFSYSVSHDLRAPLRAIDGYALMLEEDYRGRLDQEALRFLSVIRANSKRMGLLIDNLLAFSRLGRQSLAKGELNMNKLVREVIDEALLLEGGKAAKIEVGQLPPAKADRALLRQVWVNLISNALKYSGKSPNRSIEVSGRKDGIENVYSVTDNGVGFSMEYVEKLFGVFQRLHRADEFSGTGVGLAIVQRLITRHGGRVWAEGAVNKGARFSFTLPIGEAHE